MGFESGFVNQGSNSLAIGPYSGYTDQSGYAVAIGFEAGLSAQGPNSVAIGPFAGNVDQSGYAVAIGFEAALSGQGSYAIAIGANSGTNNQSPNTIILNATGNNLDSYGNTGGLYIKPIQQKQNDQILLYDVSFGEITYFSSGNVAPFEGLRAYGSFYDVIGSNGSNIPNRISFLKNGIYNMQFSAQFYHPGGGTPQINIWLRKNNIDVSYSNTSITLKASADYLVAAWNFFVPVYDYTTEYYELVWYTTDSGIQIRSDPPVVGPPVSLPGIPSLILTLNQVN
jgi:hypothetical protein